MNYKTKMMVKHKRLYGGEYYKENGKWYWKKNPEDVGILVSSGWVIKRVNEYKPEQPVPQEPVVEKPVEVLPTPKTTPKKKTTKTENKTETNQ